MRVLMVYPKYPDTFWSFKHVLKLISKKAAFPPLGLLTVASLLPDDWEKCLVDMNVRSLEDADIERADMVFISAMIVQKDSAKDVIARCKELGKTVVAGGPMFTTMHDQFPDVDHFVLNEGETTVPMFLDDLEKGELKRVYSSSERPDIHRTPLPMWSLVDAKDYASMAIQYSRGCPFNCEFCDIVIMNGRVPRTKSPGQMCRELDSLYEHGWRGSVFIVDDNFIGNKNKVKELLPAVIDWQKKHRFPFSFFTEASVNLADDEELMDLMVRSNFFKVFLGLETPALGSLEECGKFQNTNRDLVESVKTIQRRGMQVMGGFIVGFDNDPEDIFNAQVEFIQKIGCVVAMVGLLNAVPQTRLWHRLKAENRLLRESRGNNTDRFLNYMPKMGVERLLNGYEHIVKSIYSTKNYYDRIRAFIKDYNPRCKARIKLEEVKALFKSFWVVGVCSKARFHFWRLLFSTLFKKTRSFPVAVELAILGLHFQKVMESSF